MNYQQAKANVYGYCTIPCGYFGNTETVGIAFDPESGKTLFVADYGYFNAPIPPAVDVAESKWLMTHHPSANHCNNVSI